MANSSLLLGLVLTAALGAAACASGEPSDAELDAHLCAPETLGEDFQELVRGEFTPKDLADLSDDADIREEAYRDAGMKDGKFVYYKSVLPKPPFEPPLNVVCQAIEFATAEAARGWVSGLSAEDSVEALAFGDLPSDNLTASSGPPIELAPGLTGQVFMAAGGTGTMRTTVYYLVAAQERFARVVAVGSEDTFHRPPLDLLSRLWLGER